MYPHERSLVNKLTGKPFVLLGVNSDRDRVKMRETVKDKNITWRSFWNGPAGTGGPISTKWNISNWPTVYVIDAQGVIRHKQVGGTQGPLNESITSLLADMGCHIDLSDHAEY